MKKNSIKKAIDKVLAGALTVLFAGSLVGCSKQEKPAKQVVQPAVVRVAKVLYSVEAIPVYVTGLLSRKTEANLSFKLGGIVEAVLVRSGDPVKKGQVLGQLRLAEIEAHVMQARSGLEKAQRDLARVEALRADNVATLENLQDARTAVQAAAAGLQIAEFNREHAVIVAPADGRILRRLAEPEEMVEAGHPVLAFASDGDGWIVRAGVPEGDVGRLHLGDGAVIRQSGEPVLPIRGRVAQISEAADPATRTTEVELELETLPVGGRSGLVVRAVITPQPVEKRPVVVASALVEATGRKAFIFLVEANAGTVKRVPVEVAGIDGEHVFLNTRLPHDASVVTSGAEYLQEGMPVEVGKN